MKITIVLAFLFCLGLTMYSGSTIPSWHIEMLADADSFGDRVVSDIDSFQDDQISHRQEFRSFPGPLSLIPVPQNCFIGADFPITFWQPPKNS